MANWTDGIYTLNVFEEFYEHLISGRKRFDVRAGDPPLSWRSVPFRVRFCEVKWSTKEATGRHVDMMVTYILRSDELDFPGRDWGRIRTGERFWIMSLEEIPDRKE